MRSLKPLLPLLMLFGLLAHAGTPITPKTTLAAETGNNTSTSNTFIAQTNGNAGANNISKMPIRSLLYNGATTKIYTHWMPWFGTTSHMNIGYDSSDPALVSRQVADMMSRGIDGAIVDWYGPSSTHHNTATINLMKSSEATAGRFVFAITEDSGALKNCANTSGCDISAQAISDLTYAYKTFEGSAAYMKINGRPVVFFFGTEAYALDWNRIRASVPGNPLFIFRNSGAFSKLQSDGGFSWVGIASDPSSMGLSYMDGFYSTALKYPGSSTFGSGYKGFNDTLAAWGSKRVVNQQCGQTWLATFAEAGKYYSATAQLPALQIVTWNDYEEGSEVETGIENCVSITGSSSGKNVTWTITGQENTVDHYTVFISLDGQNLMPVADVPAGIHTLDLSQYGFDPANYTLYVKAVAKASMTNKMSGPILWTLTGIPPVARLAVTPTNGIAPTLVSADASSSLPMNGTITATSIDFGDGAIANSAIASHSYASAGTYTVTASVTDSFGGVGRTSTTVTVVANQAPLARLSISPASGIAPFTVSADATASADPDGKIAATTIDFGDGTIVNGATASHLYTTAGTYTITAKITDDRGASSVATTTATVVANQNPVARISVTPVSGSSPLTVTADASASTDPDGKVAAIAIDFGDGFIASSAKASHTYWRTGTFVVTATVTDDRGATSIVAKTVTVSSALNKMPVVSIAAPNTVTAGGSITAKATASDPDGTVSTVSLNWGDGSPLTNASSGSHIYSKAGAYTITATATDDRGAKTSTKAAVTVSWGVAVSAPVEGPTYSSPLRTIAKASSSVPISCIKIYLDNVAVYSVNNVSQIDTNVPMSSGSHRLVVQAWDSSGVVYKNVQNVTVK